MPGKKKARAKQWQQPHREDIEDAINQIKETDFWLCVQFADVLIRYLEITMKQDSIISRLQGSALYFLLLNGGELTPTQLAGVMLRSKHSVTKIIDSLEREGFIVRDFTNKDRRVTSVKLTSSGLEHLKQRFSKGNKRANSVMDSLDAGDRKRLVDLTEIMRKKMTAMLAGL
jgi:MarR family 2-MHQ and catechol resistance regulon transcriptional repressor